MSAPGAAALLRELVAFPTVAGTSNVALVERVAELLSDAGARVTVHAAHRPDARSLHAVVGPEDVRGVLLSAHTDVVAVDGQRWSHDPFALTARDGRLYGRGSADMKGFVAVAVGALAAAARRPLRAPLHLALSSDEELGCLGAPSLLDALARDAVRPRYAIVGEPTELRVVTQHKGKDAQRVHVRGRACHSGFAPHGVNAVEYAAELIVAIRELARELRVDGPRGDGFGVPHATLSVGPVVGGMALNTVPDACAFSFELRDLPGQDRDAVLGAVRDAAAALEREMRERAPEAEIRFEPLAAYPPLGAPVAGTADVVREVERLAGRGPGPAADFGTEAGLYARRLRIPVVVCGPGSMEQAHRPDEFVADEQLRAAEAMLERLVERLAR